MSEPQKHKLTPRQQRILADYKKRKHSATKSGRESISDIDSIESLYRALGAHEEIRAKALLILRLRSWLTAVSEFDPITGHALPVSIVDFVNTVAQTTEVISCEGEIKDRIYQIVNHTKEAIKAILEHPRDKILREHAMLPIHAAREVDSISVQWLSRQPGRTLREKLSGKPYIKAVRRRSSVDTSENRLLKAFLFRFEQILIERQSALNAVPEEVCEELLVLLQRWLRSEDAIEIGHWGNLPPNNTLLQDKRYRKVWDAWLCLQNLDENIKADHKRLQQDLLTMIYWNVISFLSKNERFRTVQQPLKIDYDKFSITTILPINGFLFPNLDHDRQSGKIKNIPENRDFGFISAAGKKIFFHKQKLAHGLCFSQLKEGDTVAFDIGYNQQGECAINVNNVQQPTSFSAILEDNRIVFEYGEKRVTAGLDHITVIHPQKRKQKVPLHTSSVTNAARVILEHITDTSTELFPNVTLDIGEEHVHIESAVIDLCSIRPELACDSGQLGTLPFRLLLQNWQINPDEKLAIDCGQATAIRLDEGVETISLRSLLAESTLSDAVKSSAAMFFTKKLRDYISANRLSYLVPDWGNDFDLECIRKSVNFYFRESSPLPKSIAAIFGWQSSQRFEQDKVCENDFVLVADVFAGGISITPAQAIYQKELNEILPESKGISWERHPTFAVGNNNIHTGMVRNLSLDGCKMSEELIQLFGFDGLVSDAGELSFVNDDDWYHVSNSIRETLKQKMEENVLSSQTISNCLNSTNRDWRGVQVFILPLEDTIKKTELGRQYKWLESAWSPIKGCQTLNEWQKEAADIVLWRDHLPELSIRIVRDGHYENFYLVKDATVTPQRGKTVAIPVKESFTLSSGQSHYSFPLQQGEGNQELQFVAYLKSSAFPLKEKMACKLQMTYTYGADDPYELKFIPLDANCTDFKSIRVEWRSVEESAKIDSANLLGPIYPARKTWSGFQKFPKENGTEFSDLLDWVKRDMDQIIQLSAFITGSEESERIYDNEVIDRWDWREDRNGKRFCSVQYDFGAVFFHESNFEYFNSEAEEISFDKEQQRNRDGFIARNVTIGRTIPRRTVDHFKKSLPFPVLTIWNNGHSLSEPDVPDDFRGTVFSGIKSVLSMIESENLPESLKKELFFFLSCLHKDAPPIVGTRLLEAVTDKKNIRKYNRNIAFAIGDAELPWQKKLFKKVVDLATNERMQDQISTAQKHSIENTVIGTVSKWELIDKNGRKYGFVNFRGKDYFYHESAFVKISQAEYLAAEDSICFTLHEDKVSNVLMVPNIEGLEILSIALWRSKDLISKLTENELKVLNNNLYGCLEFDLQKILTGGKGYQVATLCKHLELLLALLRIRGGRDEKTNMILSPGKEITKRYVTLVDDVSTLVMESDIDLRSRISLRIEKPEMFHSTPDLLYALRMYLTGDSGANNIIITGITDD